MFLEVIESHVVTIGGQPIEFTAGEAVHTENSFKYDQGQFLRLADNAGFVECGRWTDDNNWFAVFLLEVA